MGGMETYCLRLVERLRARHDLDLMALPGRKDGKAPSAGALIAFGIASFIRLLFRPPADIVHVGDMASWPLGWAAVLRSNKPAIVLSAHGSDVSYASRQGWRAKLYGMYLRLGGYLLRRAHVIANSQWIAKLARESGFRDVSVIRMGTDFTYARDECPSGNHLLFAGRIAPGKGLRFLVEDVLPLIPNPPKLRVAGTVWDKEEAVCLSSPHVEWLGKLSPEELAREYASALAVLIPSQLPEGFGLVAAEAAASGGLVIAADHSGLAEAVLPQTGFLLPVGDAQAWADQIIRILDWQEAERETFITSSSTTARKTYNWDRTANETEKVYSRLMRK